MNLYFVFIMKIHFVLKIVMYVQASHFQVLGNITKKTCIISCSCICICIYLSLSLSMYV